MRSPVRTPVRSPVRPPSALAEGGVFASVPPFAGFAFCRHIYVTTSSVHEFDAISISACALLSHRRPSQHPAIASALATQRLLGRTAGIDRRRLVRRGCGAAAGPGDGAERRGLPGKAASARQGAIGAGDRHPPQGG